jgi:hypothetical protein
MDNYRRIDRVWIIFNDANPTPSAEEREKCGQAFSIEWKEAEANINRATSLL